MLWAVGLCVLCASAFPNSFGRRKVCRDRLMYEPTSKVEWLPTGHSESRTMLAAEKCGAKDSSRKYGSKMFRPSSFDRLSSYFAFVRSELKGTLYLFGWVEFGFPSFVSIVLASSHATVGLVPARRCRFGVLDRAGSRPNLLRSSGPLVSVARQTYCEVRAQGPASRGTCSDH